MRDEECRDCGKALPGKGGTYRRASEAGWSRVYYGGAGFRCPTCRAAGRVAS